MTDAPTLTDPARFRQVLAHFCSGIVVVTALDGDQPIGLTCQSFSALSLDPPLVQFSPARSSTTWPRIRATGRFAINILAAHQRAVSQTFAVSGGDKFAGLRWHAGPHGQPLLDGALAHIECRLTDSYPGGDHEIVVGHVLDLVTSEESTDPLLYFRSQYRRLQPWES
ncbi:flavin reductase family protein [Cryptosporangium aurantiacum]|uniref:NADH-FMN oxidoreductase RutF, flavin reductase (DIM6/NTAB) family n=1 Tax=Cryptosporangium aurantiacum TaxID=134849 RepID=A0A1M7PER8_9ACTN|nr:flavin reductase family protein [Cryptosporangium aurantiacum]SHN15197.1 NADH-FMN oxidoreductase RutF, flavin reductase (DIM6/NTAB) family [Cryptosporangium aurantiacum]